MSRSYRKPYVTDGYKGSKKKQYYKKLANNVVGKAQDVPDGNAYRKFFETWEIRDYHWYENPKSEYWSDRWWRLIRK